MSAPFDSRSVPTLIFTPLILFFIELQMKCSQMLLTAQKVLVRSATGAPTGITGVLQHPNPKPALQALYKATLAELEGFPSDSVYRKAVHNLTTARLAVVEAEEVVEKMEAQIGCGLIEEVVIQADEELQLVKKMKEWKVWEPLQDKSNPDQWVYFGNKP